MVSRAISRSCSSSSSPSSAPRATAPASTASTIAPLRARYEPIAPGDELIATGRERILEIDPEAVVVMITAHGSVDTAVEAMKRGEAVVGEGRLKIRFGKVLS